MNSVQEAELAEGRAKAGHEAARDRLARAEQEIAAAEHAAALQPSLEAARAVIDARRAHELASVLVRACATHAAHASAALADAKREDARHRLADALARADLGAFADRAAELVDEIAQLDLSRETSDAAEDARLRARRKLARMAEAQRVAVADARSAADETGVPCSPREATEDLIEAMIALAIAKRAPVEITLSWCCDVLARTMPRRWTGPLSGMGELALDRAQAEDSFFRFYAGRLASRETRLAFLDRVVRGEDGMSALRAVADGGAPFNADLAVENAKARGHGIAIGGASWA